jgi:type II secretory pathway predicted ATPase ExeA
MNDLSHLLASVQRIAEGDREARLGFLREDRWIDYPRAASLMSSLEELVLTPPRPRMPCILLHGDSGMGKTVIIQKFKQAHRSHYSAKQGVEQHPVIVMQMPSKPTDHRFYSRLLDVIGAPYRQSDRVAAMEGVALRLLRRLQPRMIVVDEVHHFTSGSAREQRASLNLMKYIVNEIQCSMVAVGTRDALVAMAVDPQMESRFTPYELPRWTESDEFRRFLMAFERVLPLRKPSQLADRATVQTLLLLSGGITGRVTQLLTEATQRAIHSGKEMIDPALLESIATNQSAILQK